MSDRNLPKITMITPSLNQGIFIEQAIRSVLTQNYPELEYIIVDGGSSDNTLDILKKYSSQVKSISEKDNGQTHAINKGIKLATGEIIAYLNADDILLPGSLERVAHAFTSHPNTKWLTGQCRIIDSHGNEIRRAITLYKNSLLRIRGKSLLLTTNYISQPATFWRKEVTSTIGYFDEELSYVMDYEYWLRLYSRYPLLFIKEYLAAFKIHRTSKTTSTGHKKVYIDEEKDVVTRHARSPLSLPLHNLHRLLMSSIYTLINR